MTERPLDVSGLPSYKFSHHSLMWWGVMGMILLEGTAFALTIAVYFYLWSQAQTWPLSSPPPDLFWGTFNLVVLLASAWPNHWTKHVGEDGDEDELAENTKKQLTKGELKAVIARRDKIVERFDKLVAEKGEGAVLY